MWLHISDVADVVVGGLAARVLQDSARQWIGFRFVRRPSNDNAPWYIVAQKRVAPDAQACGSSQASIRGYSVATGGRGTATECGEERRR